MSDAETKQIEGVCEEISEKNGWTSFAINVGSQYPVRISTKLPALIEQGRAVGQERAVWTFKETQGGENPNKPGTFYTNRYFESVEVGGTAVPAATSSPSRNVGSSTPDETRSSIERQTVLKAAMTMYEQFADDDQFFAFCDAAAAFVADRPLPPAIDADGGTADDIPFD